MVRWIALALKPDKRKRNKWTVSFEAVMLEKKRKGWAKLCRLCRKLLTGEKDKACFHQN